MGVGASVHIHSDNADTGIEQEFHRFGLSFQCYTAEPPSADDYNRAITSCISLLSIKTQLKVTHRHDFLEYFSPLIIFYDKFFTDLASREPTSSILRQGMPVKLSFFADLIATVLCVTNASTRTVGQTVSTTDSPAEHRRMVGVLATKYALKGLCFKDYGAIGAAVVHTMSVSVGDEELVWKRYKWSRLYSHFLRLLLQWTKENGFPDMNDASTSRNPVSVSYDSMV